MAYDLPHLRWKGDPNVAQSNDQQAESACQLKKYVIIMNTGHLILKNKIPVPFSLGINSYDIILSSHFLILFYALFSELYFVLCISLN